MVTPKQTKTNRGAKNHRKGSRRPSNKSLRRGESVSLTPIRSKASNPRVVMTAKGDTSGVCANAIETEAIDTINRSVGKVSRITNNRLSSKVMK